MIDSTGHINNMRFIVSSDNIKQGGQGPASNSFSSVLERQLNSPLNRTEGREGLREACVELESIFVGRMLKEMRKTVHKSGWLNGGQAEEIFEDMLYDEYAMNVSRNSKLGIADMLYREMSRKL